MVQVADENGKTVTHSFLKKDDALEYFLLMRQNRARLRAAMDAVLVPRPFSLYADTWVRRREKEYPKSTTAGEKSKLTNVWKPYLADTEMHRITTATLKRRLEQLLTDGLSEATYNRHRALLSVIFESARKDKAVRDNPVRDIPALEEKAKQVTVWAEDQIRLYLEEAYREGFVYGALGTMLVFGGPRINECLALRWGDIYWEFAAIMVTRTWELETATIVDRTKGKGDGGSYSLLLLPVVEKALKMWQAQTKLSQPKDLIFVHWKTPITYWQYERLHHLFIERAGLPRITPHELRHAFASHGQRKGLSREDLQGLLGHASIQTTQRYSHVDLRDLAEKAKRIGFGAAEFLFPAQPKLNTQGHPPGA